MNEQMDKSSVIDSYTGILHGNNLQSHKKTEMALKRVTVKKGSQCVQANI